MERRIEGWWKKGGNDRGIMEATRDGVLREERKEGGCWERGTDQERL